MWPFLNIWKICFLSANGDGQSSDSRPKEYSYASELIMRYIRWGTYIIIAFISYTLHYEKLLSVAGIWKIDWVLEVVVRNLVVMLCTYGFWHVFLYQSSFPKKKLEGRKFNGNDQYEGEEGRLTLNREIMYTTLGFLQSSAWECCMLYLWASGKVSSYSSFWSYPIWSLFHLAYIGYWRDGHFYFVHRMMHPWRFQICGVDPGKLLYRHVHSLHHKSYNPGPWAGLSMHPVEHFFYYSCTALPLLFTLHPFHFLVNKFHADVSPVAGHDGFDSPAGGSYFHYLHHAYFEVNYGTPLVPFDSLFGTFDDGSKRNNLPKKQN